ncbi:Apolipoprotein N-acyltransferase [Rubrivivax sp. A210]|uniref:apolipoprotein N-acyltransferase n=1 Tax=Rubrivivax sp. A210 TaxID=2772301 RepID=UPI00191AF889|nr:apolipoprotein N-acyltransferase [Rubrivivax sp. A210]CAD5374080.1 Apolipoprotein N-acyltransferase [Rubrivivax sp. A210]
MPVTWRGGVLAALLGAAQTLALVHTTLWPLPLLTAAWLAGRLDRATPRGGFVLGLAYGTAWIAAAVWWLFISMHRYGGLAAPLAAAAVLALALALGLFLALAGAAYARWRHGRAADAVLFAALWLLAELGRGMLFTGFPWGASGYTQVDAPLAVLAPWLGVYGMGAALALAAAALARLVASRWRAWPLATGVALALGAAAAVGPAAFTRPAGEISVALLQTNISQDEKFAAERMPATLAWLATALAQAEAELVVAPETAVPLLPDQLEDAAPGYWQALEAQFAQPGRAALVGLPLGDYERGYRNAVAGLSAGPPYRYAKAHLVPFGEFIPTGFRWFTELMNIPLGDFDRGEARPPSFAVGAQRVAPNICYEDLFGEDLARRFADAATAPTLLANLSNIGWFGDSIAIPQHLNISRLRALEFERSMLRATNTGATAIIGPDGRVQALLTPHTRGVLTGRAQGREGLTPYAAWAARFGLWPLVLGALALAFATSRPWRRP